MKHSLTTKTSSLHMDDDDEDASSSNDLISSFPSKKNNSNNRNVSNSTLLFAAGFFSCMVVMELALEGANNAFPDLEALPFAITLFQFGFCFLLPLLVSWGESLASFPKTPKESIPYISLSVVVFGSTCLASMSVRYVSYPTKVVFKSAKLIPTMIVATFLQRGSINNKSYAMLDYLAASLLCAGAAGYGWGGASATSNNDNSVTGVSLLLVSVFCDAFTPNIQQRLMAPPSSSPAVLPTTNISSPISIAIAKASSLVMPGSGGGGLGLSPSALMTNANGVGCIGLLIFMTLGGSLLEALSAAITHPFLLVYLTIVGMALATAVLCYTRLIRESGSVVAVAVATLRKVATVILSYVVYPKAISMIHVVSGFLVLGGILLSTYSKQRSSSRK